MKRLFLSGFLYTAIGRYSNVLIAILVDIFLSRLLSPADYGIVAILTVLLALFQLFSDAGIGAAIIQNRKVTQSDLRTLFTLSFILAIFLGITFGLIGIPLAWFYQNKIYAKLTWFLALAVVFFALVAVPKASMLRQKKFKEVNYISVFAGLCGGSTGIIIAILGGGVYALLFNTVVNSFVTLIVTICFSKVWPTKVIHFKPIIKIYSFATNQLGFNIVNYIAHNLDSILIAKYMSAGQLGIYNKAYRLILYPTSMFNGLITPILLPVLADHQSNVSVIRNVYLKLQHITALIAIPLSVFLFFSANSIINTLYGEQWQGAALPFAILSLSVWTQMLNANAEAIFQSRNKVKKLLKIGIYTAIFDVVATIVGVMNGNVVSVSVALLLSFSVNGIYVLYTVMHEALESNFWTLLKELKSGFILGLVTAFVLVLYNFIFIQSNAIIDLSVRIFLFIIVFVAGSILLGELTKIKLLLAKEVKGD
ncbi:lipopolysaccharide biosynthesis protein [Leuconostoc gelidum subsp. gelidum]|uniref:lipopolysaccharide biosynthesis protein n=1 Tax=Leuconostoc gelidum TaxID=1244 RepID=UPI001CC5D9F2|nr:lipopolysaccharide biosynthesis protein [Leuconostoc gelidum]MBZ5975038.1 lipopolysaccharide biosynthesis protein [Leuconostoc gelidum subsp. gelidum]MBZ5978041.1 lipopolysaccharide biosynthesis protein [Leuconostoc gelidum subsp. gelidum]